MKRALLTLFAILFSISTVFAGDDMPSKAMDAVKLYSTLLEQSLILKNNENTTYYATVLSELILTGRITKEGKPTYKGTSLPKTQAKEYGFSSKRLANVSERKSIYKALDALAYAAKNGIVTLHELAMKPKAGSLNLRHRLAIYRYYRNKAKTKDLETLVKAALTDASIPYNLSTYNGVVQLNDWDTFIPLTQKYTAANPFKQTYSWVNEIYLPKGVARSQAGEGFSKINLIESKDRQSVVVRDNQYFTHIKSFMPENFRGGEDRYFNEIFGNNILVIDKNENVDVYNNKKAKAELIQQMRQEGKIDFNLIVRIAEATQKNLARWESLNHETKADINLERFFPDHDSNKRNKYLTYKEAYTALKTAVSKANEYLSSVIAGTANDNDVNAVFSLLEILTFLKETKDRQLYLNVASELLRSLTASKNHCSLNTYEATVNVRNFMPESFSLLSLPPEPKGVDGILAEHLFRLRERVFASVATFAHDGESGATSENLQVVLSPIFKLPAAKPKYQMYGFGKFDKGGKSLRSMNMQMIKGKMIYTGFLDPLADIGLKSIVQRFIRGKESVEGKEIENQVQSVLDSYAAQDMERGNSTYQDHEDYWTSKQYKDLLRAELRKKYEGYNRKSALKFLLDVVNYVGINPEDGKGQRAEKLRTKIKAEVVQDEVFVKRAIRQAKKDDRIIAIINACTNEGISALEKITDEILGPYLADEEEINNTRAAFYALAENQDHIRVVQIETWRLYMDVFLESWGYIKKVEEPSRVLSFATPKLIAHLLATSDLTKPLHKVDAHMKKVCTELGGLNYCTLPAVPYVLYDVQFD